MAYVQMLCLEPTRLLVPNKNESNNFDKNRFSASYGGTSENFIVDFTIESDTEVDIDEYGILCVVQNILQRGRFTQPSCFLKGKLGEIDQEPVPLIKDDTPEWHNIKGDEVKDYYPAREFFYEILLQYLTKEYAFVQSLILPEADFKDILRDSRDLDGQQVDFYLPQANLVIEIDGASHNDSAQQEKDTYRDKSLNKEGIAVARIATKDIQERNEILARKMQEIMEIIQSNDNIARYREALSIDSKDKRIRYDAIMRLEMALLTGFRSGKLSLEKPELKIHVKESDVSDIEELILCAYQDLHQWIFRLSELAKIDFSMPTIKFAKKPGREVINLDFSMFKRYVDTDLSRKEKDTIYIRTSYVPQADYYRLATSVPLKYQFKTENTDEENDNLRYIMQSLFGHKSFRDGQLPIIKNALRYEDTIGILPTGTGKSMCYQMAALLQPGISLVVVPLISLMQDQKKGMDQRGINRVAYISSDVHGEARKKVMRKFMAGKYQFMILSPERTQSEDFINILQFIDKSSNFAYGVIDEVHCLSEWGHDFRVSYLRLIPTLRKYCTHLCLIGLTATASQAVLDDLKAEFDNDGSGIRALSSMDRKELSFKRFAVCNESERKDMIERIIEKNDGVYCDSNHVEKNSVGLIFCQTVRGKNKPSCNTVSQFLNQTKELHDRVLVYNGQLPSIEKRRNQQKFMQDGFSGVMVCTNAFGMGIDKENIKYTIHTGLPKSIESFFQEAGRAGRDEDKTLMSHCYIVYKPEEPSKKNNIEKIFNANTSLEERKKLSDHLGGDLSTIMYFWNTNRKPFAEEYERIQHILDTLNCKKKDSFPFFKEEDLTDIQDALYRLALLGIIEGWTIKYTGAIDRGFVTVKGNKGLDKEAIRNNLVKYIRKHDAEFTLDGNITRYEKYHKMLSENPKKPIKNLVHILMTWTEDNILYNRLQSMYNMYQLCSDKVTDSEFRKRIVDYFRYTEDSVVFEDIVRKPLDYKYWFTILTYGDDNHRSIINQEKASTLLSSLVRYLESYGNNTGLNYLSGILRLMIDDFEGTEGEWRLKDSFRYIKESLPTGDQQNIISDTIKIAQIRLNENNKNNLSKSILDEFPELDSKLYEALNDQYSLSHIIKRSTENLRNIMENKLKWTM